MSRLKFNKEPYFDDFEVEKNYFQILFKPKFAVQTRELNQLQSILSNQTEQFADHIFKFGSSVVSGSIKYNPNAKYVRLKDYDFTLVSGEFVQSANFVNVGRLENRKVKGITTGLEAQIFLVEPKTEFDPVTLYVKYTNTAVDGETSVFLNGETLEVYDEDGFVTYYVQVRCVTCEGGDDGSIAPTGIGSLIGVADSVYYVHGKFVSTYYKLITLDKYSNTPSYKVGFDIVQSYVSASDDPSLYDNALGTPNYTAPGADRYKMELSLSKKPLDDEDDESFILISRIEGGYLQAVADKPQYGDIMNMIARRTYDESGDYTVRSFRISFKEHLKQDATDTSGWKTAADGGDSSKVAIEVSPGKAYVRGREVERIANSIVEIDKARSTRSKESVAVRADYGNYILIKLDSTSNIIARDTTISSNNLPNDFNKISLYDGEASGGATTGQNIGYCRTKAMELYSGTAGQSDAVYKLYIFDVNITTTGKTFNDVRSVYKTDTTVFIGNVQADAVDSSYKIYDAYGNYSLFRTPYEYTESIRDANNEVASNTSFTIQRRFVGTTDSAGNVTFSATANELFLSYDSKTWIAGIKTGSNFVPYDLTPTGKVSTTIDTITISHGTPNVQIALICPVVVNNAKEKTKTVTLEYLDQAEVTDSNQQIQCGNKCDVFEIVSATYKYVTGDETKDGDDWTDKFTLYTNAKDNYYDISYVKLNEGEDAPADGDRIDFVFKYFLHGSEGYYFSVDSYGGIDYEDIPTYTTKDGSEFKLSDTLDFRSTIGQGLDFEGSGGIISQVPYTGTNITFDISHYLARTDILVVNEFGEVYTVSGNPSTNPVAPRIPDQVMHIYTIFLEPYTFDVKENIRTRFIDNKRYTMRDIGRLEDRIENLEYYASFNLLEKATSDSSILDADGNNRFKNGFLVDNFRDFNGSLTSSPEYSVALDNLEGELRPSFKDRSIPLKFDSAASTGYVNNNNIITLPFSERLYIEQPFATKSFSVTPYLVYQRKGEMALKPDSDFFKDTTTLPDLVVDIDTGVDAVRRIANEAGITGVTWNSWQTTSRQNLGVTREVTTTGNWRQGSRTTNTFRTTRETQQRTGTALNVASRTTNTSLGTSVKTVDMIPFMRSTTIQFFAVGLLPNTRMYAFFDGVDVNEDVSPINQTKGQILLTDSDGKIAGNFRIPNRDNKRFGTGQRMFRITNSATNSEDEDALTTFAEAEFNSGGLKVTEQETVLSVTTPRIVERTLTQQRTNTTRNLVASRTQRWNRNGGDPLAQSFRVEEENGVFLASVDFYFEQVATERTTVWVEIRNMVNGYPGQVVVPFSHIEKFPESCKTSTDGSVATNFKFEAPVYLESDQEYCIVIGSDDINYRIFGSRLGQPTLGSNPVIVSNQPSMGSLFKSQNASTWTAEQQDDLKFKLNRARFNDGEMTLQLHNDYNNIYERELLKERLPDNPFETEINSRYVRVIHPSHGYTKNDKVKLEVFSDTNYQIELTAGTLVAGDRISGAGSSAYIKDIEFDSTNPETGNSVFNVKLAELVGGFDDGDNFTGTTPYQAIIESPVDALGGNDVWQNWLGTTGSTVGAGTFVTGVGNDFNGLPIDKVSLDEHVIVFVDSMDSYIIEVDHPGGATSSGRTGGTGAYVESQIQVDAFYFHINQLDFTGNANWKYDGITHKVINGDTADNYLITENNEFNSNETSYLDSPLKIATQINQEEKIGTNKKSIVLKGTYSVNSDLIDPTDGGGWISPVVNIKDMQFITVTNRIDFVDCSTFAGLDAVEGIVKPNEAWDGVGGNDSCIDLSTTYKQETNSSGGSEGSKYVMNPVTLLNPASAIKVYVDILDFDNTSVDLYYRTLPTYFEQDITTVDWTYFDWDEEITSETDTDFREVTASIPDLFGEETLEEFKSFQIKLVLRSKNSARPPKCKNFRAIAVT